VSIEKERIYVKIIHLDRFSVIFFAVIAVGQEKEQEG
jgi:hypothetical protein